jgi:hypothetical protein
MTTTSSAHSLDGPYDDQAANLIYQLLFCDRLELFKENHEGTLEPPWTTLFAEDADFAALKKIAEDSEQESRVRMLAFNRLRASGQPVPNREYLGTIIEVRLSEGLDTLAVFADGRARYLNYSGAMVVVEGTPSPFDSEINQVIQASQPIVAAIGPWDKERLPPPPEGNIRMTFLVSDGLYFGEGPMEVMQQEPLAAPLVSAATNLLLRLVDNRG